ncbi:MAG TPA: 2-phospho-L-lactate transferase [Ornithinimicrobium sp.]|uniref:2-phospho-L-lactate transferase n=1 Tax=Ornithinimicrobium sp. TaxID=1977084 RepID=UPI002B49C39A|nr:2-phospho-L-lactate transferase [Ornithinimicrobium sp.]HKJ12611.1 2-phospho-L-lactate transferase [Ornithinimicrobium sp.]
MHITVLAGGVGGARFVRGLRHHLDTMGEAYDPATGSGSTVTVIGNTGDDITIAGLRVCPDLDTLLYTLGSAVHEEQGWGRADEAFRAQQELDALEVGPSWFALGDRDLGTHVARSHWLAEGVPLSQVTARLARRWGLTQAGIALLPATDEPIETHVVLSADPGGRPGEDPGERAVHFQQWWIQMQAQAPALRFVVAGLARATPGPGVLEAIRKADVVLLPPSNPVVSIGIITSIPGVRDALRGTRAPVVGVSPIIGGAPVRGHADACLSALGVPVTAAGVAGLYRDFLNGWLVDSADGGEDYGALPMRARDLHMRDVGSAGEIAQAAIALAEVVR